MQLEDSTVALTKETWPVESHVTLCRVAWDSSYRDVVRFETEEERTSYFESLESESVDIDKLVYCRPGVPIKINIPYSACFNYNYCIVENPFMQVPGEKTPPKLFYFVNKVDFAAPNTSILNVVLDVFQTYLFEFEVGWSFLERGHLPIKLKHEEYKTNHNMLGIRKYYSVSEGLDIGNEYIIDDKESFDITSRAITEFYDVNLDWVYIVMSTTSLEGDFGTLNEPNLDTAQGNTVDYLCGGCEIYAVNAAKASYLFSALKTYPWISSGIISITAFPAAYLNRDQYFQLVNENGEDIVELGNTGLKMLKNFTIDTNNYFARYGSYTAHTMRQAYTVPQKIEETIRSITDDDVSKWEKLYTYPYTVIEIQPRTGTPLLLKPELLSSRYMDLYFIACCSPAHMRIGIYPLHYGSNETVIKRYDDVTTPFSSGGVRATSFNPDNPTRNQGTYNDGGTMEQTAIWFDNFPKFSIVNDNYIMYLASTANTRKWQYQSAGWTVDKSSAASMLSYEQSAQSIATERENFWYNFAGSGVNSAINVVGNAAAGNVSGAIGSAISGTTSLVFGYEKYQNQLDLAEYLNDSNLDLATYTQIGDYQNTIASINATVQDAALTQPSCAGTEGGNGFAVANGLMGFNINIKTPKPEYLRLIANYFGRYGYAYHEFVKPPKNLKAMKHFTYWKMKDVYLICTNADENSKETIRGIFQRGVTVWDKPEEIGRFNPVKNHTVYND